MKLESDHVFRENTEKKEHEKTALGCAMWEKPLGTQERLFFWGGGLFCSPVRVEHQYREGEHVRAVGVGKGPAVGRVKGMREHLHHAVNLLSLARQTEGLHAKTIQVK